MAGTLAGLTTSTIGVAPTTAIGVKSPGMSKGSDFSTLGKITTLFDTTDSVLPSGAERASACRPTMPPAPGWLSTTTGALSALRKRGLRGARDGVDAGAGGIGQDEAHGAILLRERRAGGEEKREEEFQALPFHALPFFLRRLARLFIHPLPDLQRHRLLPFFQDVADEADRPRDHAEAAHDARRYAKLARECADGAGRVHRQRLAGPMRPPRAPIRS